jgi:hypothetical protein
MNHIAAATAPRQQTGNDNPHGSGSSGCGISRAQRRHGPRALAQDFAAPDEIAASLPSRLPQSSDSLKTAALSWGTAKECFQYGGTGEATALNPDRRHFAPCQPASAASKPCATLNEASARESRPPAKDMVGKAGLVSVNSCPGIGAAKPFNWPQIRSIMLLWRSAPRYLQVRKSIRQSSVISKTKRDRTAGGFVENLSRISSSASKMDVA